ncbi:tRNA (N(6)-L-threonylcarbamoyladenosine(37)-C(2))-methylthiotransferase MtaB [Gemmatimonas aurantiaca]|nr:tRNA (N(6)-L-threonylcarbamoyladenosine(37)-C(2))-methylthiotransferase MtaB [Gemmatimonas aurantiaca]
MKQIATHTLGCRLNQFETEKIAASLYPAGFERAEFSDSADVYLINTCTVTHKADATCRQVISNVARRKGSAKLVVVGCYVESDRARVAGLAGVDLVIGNHEKNRSREIIQERWPELFPPDFSCGERQPLSGFHNRSRAWLKISDGCNQKCSFCIIPTVRGALRNNSAPNVIRDINELVSAGYSEVVLTGVHIGHFKDSRCEISSLVDLLKMILRETDIPRLRLSSLEPQVVNDEIISLMSEETLRVCRYLHLPLQSGSDAVLSAMRRPYNRARYLEVISSLKKAIPEITIGGDVIVGFPGESDADFSATVEVTDSGSMDYLHVFTYSDRTDTRASAMQDKINPQVIAARHKTLRQISKRRLAEAHQRAVGSECNVISENRDPDSGRWQGVTDNFLTVLLPDGVGGNRNIHQVLAGEYQDGRLDCEPISSTSAKLVSTPV